MRSLQDYTNEELINALIAAGYDASENSDDDIETAVENLSENPSGFGPDAYRNTVIQYIESHTGRAQGFKKRGKNKRSRKTRGKRSRKTKRSRRSRKNRK